MGRARDSGGSRFTRDRPKDGVPSFLLHTRLERISIGCPADVQTGTDRRRSEDSEESRQTAEQPEAVLPPREGGTKDTMRRIRSNA